MNVTENIIKRIEIQRRCKHDLEYRARVMEMCRRDIIFFCDYFVVTFNPRVKPSVIPLVLFPKQRELMLWIEERHSKGEWGVLEKSRYTGASVLACTYLVHKWLFNKNFAGGIASRKASLVDSSGDPDCLFEKIRMTIKKLPSWMVPAGWENVSRLNNVVNPSNGSTITGAAGDEIGRGARREIVIGDEFAFVERSPKVVAALSETTDCFIAVSTPNGTNNEQYRMRSSGAFPVFRLHWSDDPRRSEDWYQEQKKKFPAAQIAQELDIDYMSSVEGTVISGDWIRAAINAHEKIKGLAKASTRHQVGMDVGLRRDKCVLVRRRGVIVEEIEIWKGTDPTQAAFTAHNWILEKGQDRKYPTLVVDATGAGEGVIGTLNSIYDRPYNLFPWHGAGKPTDGDDGHLTNREKFLNRRAEDWITLADRFRKTYEVIEGINDHPLEDLISIPNHSDLILQLGQPTVKYTSNGKLKLESKQELSNRGLSSPDVADALVYAFARDGHDIDWLYAV